MVTANSEEAPNGRLSVRLETLERTLRAVEARAEADRARMAETERVIGRVTRLVEGDKELGFQGLTAEVRTLTAEVREWRKQLEAVEKAAKEGIAAINQERAIEAAARNSLWLVMKVTATATGATAISVLADLAQRLSG